MDKTSLLMHLASKKASGEELIISSAQISKEIQIPRQTINRKLIELEKMGLIGRAASSNGTTIRIKEKGIKDLKQKYDSLKSFFSQTKIIKGTVQSGLGEGGYYVSLPGYVREFEKKLGFIPFAGTLNLKIKGDLHLMLAQSEKIMINGFKEKDRTFGSLAAYKVKINSTNAAIIVPERTSHDKDLIEIVSPNKLRESLRLKDGDLLELVIENGI